ncbi:UNVERIFIED_CONTAM: hypothetical protein FKN15_047730 [Acipenser sinensis]
MFWRALVFELAGELHPMQTTSWVSTYDMHHLPESGEMASQPKGDSTTLIDEKQKGRTSKHLGSVKPVDNC